MYPRIPPLPPFWTPATRNGLKGPLPPPPRHHSKGGCATKVMCKDGTLTCTIRLGSVPVGSRKHWQPFLDPQHDSNCWISLTVNIVPSFFGITPV